MHLLCWSLLASLGLRAQVNIIPQPANLQVSPGHFIIDKNTALQFRPDNSDLAAVAKYFVGYINRISGIRLPLNGKAGKYIHFGLTKTKGVGPEGYQLTVSPTAIHITAGSKEGVFYALQSLRQTLPAIRTNETLAVPCMKIIDSPRFTWRGFMLDVSRHYYSVDAIMEVIDLLALYKMNVLHWHLTDNEGWRLEIKKYPKLTNVGAFRNEMPGSIFYKKDSVPLTGTPYRYGGYYTQQQAKEVVAYAASRNITVIPEIEMPGHSGAALAAYPQFSCFGLAQPVPNSSTWNGHMDSAQLAVNYCAGNDSSFLFIQDILAEVMAIFPSTYIHIGGDEVDKSYWKKCPRCQKRIRDEGLHNENELQGYFINRVEKFLLANNKKLLGWDEILEGGIASSATVMSWRGEKGGIAAAKQHHDVIMSPSDPLYFNRYQADPLHEPLAARFSINTLERVYKYDPQPNALSTQEKQFIIGGQAAIWTEFISSVQQLEYMLLPRLPAIAETLWTPLDKKNFTGFVDRLNGWHFNAWQQNGINFHPAYFYRQANESSRK
ncbi:MAG: beta-N-acetylhexosaminidase [Chitinophagaceae bacterium]